MCHRDTCSWRNERSIRTSISAMLMTCKRSGKIAAHRRQSSCRSVIHAIHVLLRMRASDLVVGVHTRSSRMRSLSVADCHSEIGSVVVDARNRRERESIAAWDLCHNIRRHGRTVRLDFGPLMRVQSSYLWESGLSLRSERTGWRQSMLNRLDFSRRDAVV